MKTYKYRKQDGSLWMFFYDTNIRLWTAFEIDVEGNQISVEADYFHNKTQMIEAHGFNLKNFIYS